MEWCTKVQIHNLIQFLTPESDIPATCIREWKLHMVTSVYHSTATVREHRSIRNYAEVQWCCAHRQAYHFFTLIHCRGRMPKLGKSQRPLDNLTVVLGVSVGLVCKELELIKVFVHWVLHQLIHEMKQCCFTYTWSCWPTMKQRVMSYMENCDRQWVMSASCPASNQAT